MSGRPYKKNKRDVGIRAMVTREEYDWLKNYAESNDVTMSDIIRAFISVYRQATLITSAKEQ